VRSGASVSHPETAIPPYTAPMYPACIALALLVSLPLFAQQNRGYYRFPAIHGNTVVFTAEGDLWQVPVEGGLARRLTSHQASEAMPRFSPDGKTLAFTANYEGVSEVYTMPAEGGLPQRRTFGGASAIGWSPDNRVLFATVIYSTIPNQQLSLVDASNKIERIPLHQAAQGVYDTAGKTVYFTRLPFQGSHAKRYKGGTAQKIWKFAPGGEAIPLTADYAGTSKDAMYWKGRVYFASDRDGTMNLWSMDESGRNLKQHTKHEGWDIASPSLHDGRIVYQLGADLHLFDVGTARDRKLDIFLPSDFDQLRERWVKNPLDYLTSVSLSPDGSSIAMTSRGRAFLIPAKQGRLVDSTGPKPARIRSADLLPDKKSVLALSTESGEVELWKLPANGVGAGERLTTDGHVLRWGVTLSPDGKLAAHTDKDNQLWLLDVNAKTQKKLAFSDYGGNSGPAFGDLTWSPDSKWLAFVTTASNAFDQISLYSVDSGQTTVLTSNRYNSGSPAWSSDGKFIYFLSDRALRSLVNSPWGTRAPDPYFDRSMKLYEVALTKDARSPFEPEDELNPEKKDEKKPEEKKAESAIKVTIDLDGIGERLVELPVQPGNYTDLAAPAKRLCWRSLDSAEPAKNSLQCIDVNNKGEKPETLMEGVRSWQLSADGKKMLVRKENDFYVFDAGIKEGAAKTPKTLTDSKVNLKDWNFAVIPSEEHREALIDAWRLHRDYFYDKNMHGVQWALMRDKYAELSNRVRDRAELSDLIAKMVSELSVLHTGVGGGDIRQAPDQVQIAMLGAYLDRDESAGGWTIKHIYRNDPDRPDKRSPLAQPTVKLSEGDVIVSINGRPTLAAAHPLELLRNQAGKQVLLRVKPAGKSETRDVIVKPMTSQQEFDLRYGEWEYTRRLEVEKASNGRIGYVHLRAMGSNDIAQWAEQYYPVFDREGLIIDVRRNGGGNIDSWILGKLLRQAWMYWKPRVGQPTWNMQYAFRGHMVVLCDEWTGSDGEAFAEGFRRLKLGQVIGTRTWGGEIWLTGSNVLADRGVATAAEIGVYGPEGKWLVEGHGVDPDIVIDNLPHATFNGKDAQLEAAIKHLEGLRQKRPVAVPAVPAHPDKSYKPAATAN
jgi:tricorn protease